MGASIDQDEKGEIAKSLERMVRVRLLFEGLVFNCQYLSDLKQLQAGWLKRVKDSRSVCELALVPWTKEILIGQVRRLKSANGLFSYSYFYPPTSTNPYADGNCDATGWSDWDAVKLWKARTLFTDDVEFSPEDAGRSDLDFTLSGCLKPWIEPALNH